MKAFFLGSTFTFNTSSTQYGYPNATGVNISTTLNTREMIVSHAMTIRKLNVWITTAPGSTKSWAITVLVNGSPSALTCTIANSATSAQDTTHDVSLSAGDRITIEIVPTNAPANGGNASWSLEQEAADVFCFNSTSGGSYSNTTTQYGVVTGENSGDSIVGRMESPIPLAGDVKNLYISLNAAPGAGKSWTFTVMKNGVATTLTCTVSDAATTANDTSHTVAVAEDDRLEIRCVPSGTPTSMGRLLMGLSYDPTSEGQSFVSGRESTGTTPDNANTHYLSFGHTSVTGSTNENNRYLFFPQLAIVRMLVRTSAAPGSGKSWAFTARHNLSDTAITATNSDSTVSSAYTPGTPYQVTAGDKITTKIVPSGSPTTASVHVAYVIVPDLNQVVSMTGYANTSAFGTIADFHLDPVQMNGLDNTGGGGASTNIFVISD